MNSSTIERFWSKVDKKKSLIFYGGSRCWEWTGGHITKGYGMFFVGFNNKGAHVVSYEIHFGTVPSGMYVCHNCDNPGCVNPSHLFIGTADDNNKDKVKKGRQAVGTKTKSSKITERDVMAIREMYSSGDFTQQAISDKFKIKRRQVSHIVRREHWRHI
jgi:hypothetical protein